jgi:hypothetical protein
MDRAAKESNGAVITAESNEVTLPAMLKAREPPRHEDNLFRPPDEVGHRPCGPQPAGGQPLSIVVSRTDFQESEQL